MSPLEEDASISPSPLDESRLGGLGVSRRNLMYGENATNEAELDVSFELS